MLHLDCDPYPLTPASSTPSPSQSEVQTPFDKSPEMDSSTRFVDLTDSAPSSLPPTPPNELDSTAGKGLTFEDAVLPQRPRRGRRPLSAYPAHEPTPYLAHRKYTDPTPRPTQFDAEEEREGEAQQLDVDLDAYSTDFDGREPTLSFLTSSSTAESTTGTPSIGGTYSFRNESGMPEKPEGEPRIRMRSTAGRANAYSSAESSGAYSYHQFENPVFHPHPPPMPVMPLNFTDRVGLGLNGQDPDREASNPSPSSTGSPVNPYSHRPWRSDIANRLRSTSVSSSFTTASGSTEETAPSASTDHYSSYHYSERLPWDIEQEEQEAEAVKMIHDGREMILDNEKLQEMGGLGGLSEEVILKLAGELSAWLGCPVQC
jgi:hypothetical protein